MKLAFIKKLNSNVKEGQVSALPPFIGAVSTCTVFDLLL